MWIVYRVSIYNLSSYYFVFIKNPYIQRHLDIGTMGSHDQEKYSVFQGYFIKKFGIEFKWNSLWGILTTRPFDRNILLCECQRWAFGFSYHGKRERESIYIYIYIIFRHFYLRVWLNCCSRNFTISYRISFDVEASQTHFLSSHLTSI